MRAGEHLSWHGNRLTVGVEVEAICELPVSMAAGVRLDGAEEVSVHVVGGREDRACPLGGLGGRQMLWPTRSGLRHAEGVSGLGATYRKTRCGGGSRN